MNPIWALSSLNLLLGVISLIIVARHEGLRRLLSSGRRPVDWLFWGSMLLAGIGVLGTIAMGPLMLPLVVVGLVVWFMRVLKYPRRILGNLGGKAMLSLVFMLLGGWIGATVFDWLRFGRDLDYPQAALSALFVISIMLLMIQRAILIAVQLHLWACLDEDKGGRPFKAVLLGLFTAYFGLIYAVIRGRACEDAAGT